MRHCVVLVLAAACAAQPAPRPDDMSAAQHRREAERERQTADRRIAEHEEGMALLDARAPGDVVSMFPSEEMRPGGLSMPGGGDHRERLAEAHAAHARQHDEAAAELERFEAAECAGVPVEERAACPLLVGVGAVLDVAGGVEVRFHAGAPVDAVVRRVRCHFAYTRARGFEEPDAALFVKGLEIERLGARVVRFTAADPEAVERIRRGIRELARPGCPAT